MSHLEYGHMVSLGSKEDAALAVVIQNIHRCSSHSKLLECIHLPIMGSCQDRSVGLGVGSIDIGTSVWSMGV